MDMKIPKNPKYANMKPTLDTGYNTRIQQEKLEENRQYYKFRPDEVFRRISVTSMVTLMLEVAKLSIQESDIARLESLSSSEVDSAIGNGDEYLEQDLEALHYQNHFDDDVDPHYEDEFRGVESVVHSGKPISRQYHGGSNRSSSVADLIQYMGQVDIQLDEPLRNRKTETDDFNSSPCLLLDVRSEEEYNRSHLITAESYPHARLSRSINFESPSMREYRNRKGKIIIVYDYDEYIASSVATTLVQRGYDNVFMLSGGLRVAEIKFPDGLIVPTNSHTEVWTEEAIFTVESLLEEALSRKKTNLRMYTPSQGPSRLSSSTSTLRSMSRSQPNLQRR